MRVKKTVLAISSLIVVGFAAILILESNLASGNLVSPLLKTKKITSLNQWFPKAASAAGEQVLGVTSEVPEITAKSAFFVDASSGKVLYQKNIHQQLPIASLVKVMTVVVALENRHLDEKFSVSKEAAEIEPDKMQLIAGESLTLKELLYGIFLVSANDAAETMAQDATGNRDEFIQSMNSKAKLLGMNNTFYANPTGLDEDSNNSYSSAYDLAILTRYAIHQFPFLVDISRTPHMYLPANSDHQDYDLYSGINLLTTYPGVIGFKTGYTPEAGLTLITLAEKDGHEVIGVLLGSEDRRDEARSLLDYSFKLLSLGA